MAPPLELMPDVVMRRILMELDYRDIQVLRKTCHLLRDFIDDNKIRTHTTSTTITIDFNKNFMGILLKIGGNTTLITYSPHENGCELSWNRSKKIVENSTYLEMFKTDFQLAVMHQNAKNSSLALKINRKNVEKDFLEIFGIHVLKVHHLSIYVLLIEIQNFEILKFIDPNFLTSLHIVGRGMVLDADHLLEFKNLKRLQIGFSVTDIPLERLINFEEVIVKYRSINFEDVVFLKEAFTAPNSSLKSFILQAKYADGLEKKIGEKFGNANDGKASRIFRICQSSRKVLRIKLGICSIEFKIQEL